MIDPYVFITLLGYSMFSMLCLELSDRRRLRIKEAISRSMLHQAILLVWNFSSPPVKHINTNGCSILLLKTKYVILARIKGCVVVSNDRVEKQQHCSEEATLSDCCSDEATLSD